MAYPFHIQKPATISAHGGTPGSAFQEYVDRLVKLIPAEVLAAYQAARGIVVSVAPTDPLAKAFLPWLPVIGLVVLIVIRTWGTRARTGLWSSVQPVAVIVAAVSFALLILSLGHPIVVQTALPTWIGSVLLIFWVIAVPYFYEGS